MANNSNIQFLNSRTKRAEDELQKTMLRIHVISFHYQTKVRLSKSSNPLSRYDQSANLRSGYRNYQRQFIEVAVQLLRVGGTLVYSTCRREGEE